MFLAKYSLGPAEKYRYINMSGCYDCKGVNETEALTEFREALALFDVSPDLEDQMFRVLASVLHLGNISYKEKADGSELEGSESRKLPPLCCMLAPWSPWLTWGSPWCSFAS